MESILALSFVMMRDEILHTISEIAEVAGIDRNLIAILYKIGNLYYVLSTTEYNHPLLVVLACSYID